MNIGKKYSVTLALALFLSLIAMASASAAEPQSRRLPQNIQAADLRAPVAEGELQTFAADMTTYIRALHDLNSKRPDIQNRLLEVQQKIEAFTPEELAILANSYDRPGLSRAVQRLKTIMPRLNARSEQGGATPLLNSVATGSPRSTPEDGSTSPANPNLADSHDGELQQHLHAHQ